MFRARNFRRELLLIAIFFMISFYYFSGIYLVSVRVCVCVCSVTVLTHAFMFSTFIVARLTDGSASKLSCFVLQTFQHADSLHNPVNLNANIVFCRREKAGSTCRPAHCCHHLIASAPLSRVGGGFQCSRRSTGIDWSLNRATLNNHFVHSFFYRSYSLLVH